MWICVTGTSSMASTSGGIPDPRGEPQRGLPAARVVRRGGPDPDIVLLGSGQQVAVAEAVAELLVRDGLAARVVAVDAEPPDEVGGVAPPGVPRVTVCGGCPETLEGIRLAAHDAVAAATHGW